MIAQTLERVAEYHVGGNTLLAWFLAVAVTLAVYWGLMLLRGVVVRKAGFLAGRTRTGIDDLIIKLVRRTNTAVVLVLSLYAGSVLLVLPPRAEWIRHVVLVVAVAVQAALWGQELVEFGLELFLRRKRHAVAPGEGAAAQAQQDAALLTTMAAAKFLAVVALYALVVLVAADNIGIDVTAMIAGLGIGGIAIALAVQNILGDLFGSLSIVLDKPFVIGDFIVIGDKMGTVEKIGLKTTRLKALSGEQLIFSNTDLLASRIQNFKRMAERRALFAIGVVYGTTPERVALAQRIITDAVKAQDKVRFDRCHFKAFSASSLEFETVYYVLSAEFGVYMDIQQAINLAILRRFAEEGIEFAYPTQTIYVARAGRDERRRARQTMAGADADGMRPG